MMTACDLSAACKAPDVVLEHTLELYVEFHEQVRAAKTRSSAARGEGVLRVPRPVSPPLNPAISLNLKDRHRT